MPILLGKLALPMAAVARASTAEVFSISAMISSCIVKLYHTNNTATAVKLLPGILTVVND